MPDEASASAWARCMADLAATGDRLSGEMAARGQPVEPGDVYATLLGALSDAYLNQIGVSPACPSFVPCAGYFQRLGSPNPDTVYRRAPVDPAGTYRLAGKRGSAADVTIMPFTATMQGAVPFDLSSVARGTDGSFDLLVSVARPKDHAGDWWQLDPATASLWLREVSVRWGEDEPSQIAITRLDTGSRQRVPANALSSLAMRVERIAQYGLDHADKLAAEGYVNRLKQVDYSQAGGMPLQWYHEGLFELADDQCLLVEAQLPPDCSYFSWSLTDRMLVTLDWANAHTSLNSAQASVDPEGMLRVVIAARDPGMPNWLETMGYSAGVLQCRSSGCQAPPVMSAKLVPLAQLTAASPGISPQQRLAALRQRQIGSQMRRLW